MTAILDTNILLHLLRKTELVPVIQKELKKNEIKDPFILSIVSTGEIESIANKRHYGKRKRNYLKELLQDFIVVPIQSTDLVDRYAEIDAYSRES